MKSIILLSLLAGAVSTKAQNVTRIARLTIDSLKLDNYKLLLKEQMDAAVKFEPGVISYQVYADKMHPQLLTIVEVYADNAAYRAHRETRHFMKYKAAVTDMVKSLELTEVQPVFSVAKK